MSPCGRGRMNVKRNPAVLQQYQCIYDKNHFTQWNDHKGETKSGQSTYISGSGSPGQAQKFWIDPSL